MWHDLTVLAVVPARGGSKGIPGKNLAQLGGMSLVGRAVDTARSLRFVDHVVLSTDDPDIAAEATRHRVDVPWMRPSELATDLATGLSVWRHAVEQAELDMGTRYHLSVLLQPTSPFRRPDDVEACVELLVGSDFGLVTTVSPTPAHYSPEKTMVLDTSRRVEPYLTPSGFQPTRQLIPTYYHLNGICYAALREVILERDQLIGDDAGAVVIDRPMVNIDEPFDLELAGWLWERYGADAEGLT